MRVTTVAFIGHDVDVGLGLFNEFLVCGRFFGNVFLQGVEASFFNFGHVLILGH